MIRGKRNLLWLGPLVLLLAWPLYGGALRWLLAPPEFSPGAEPTDSPEEQQQHFTMSGVRFFQEVAGQRQWRIDSRELRTGVSDEQLLLAGVTAVLFRDGGGQVEIVARRGQYDSSREILELAEDVRLQDASGFRLLTPALTHHGRENRVSSRAGVEVSRDDLQVRGRELDYFPAEGRYVISGDVRLILN